MAFSGHHQLKAGLPRPSRLASHSRQISLTGYTRHSATVVSDCLVPHASPGRSGSSAKSPQQAFSVMQSAMKIPGLASALHLIGVPSGPNGTITASGDSTVAAAGSSGTNGGSLRAPEDLPASTEAQPVKPEPQLQPLQPLSQLTQVAGSIGIGSGGKQAPQPASQVAAPSLAAAADVANAAGASAASGSVYNMAAAAADKNGNGHVQFLPQQQSTSQGLTPAVRHTNSVLQHRNSANSGEALPLAVVNPIGLRTENNIAPYSGPLPSLAGQIREIASILRRINALRIQYLDKITQQEVDLAAKDQALRSREERIKSLEREAAELRRSLEQLQTAKPAAEGEGQRLRASTSASAATSPGALLASEAAASTEPVSVPPPEAPTVPAAPRPHHLTAPPVAVVASAPASVAFRASLVTPAPLPPPRPPPPPPPPRIPEIMLTYRSSWLEAYLHCNTDGRGWTALPGVRMEATGSKEYVVRVQGRSMEFVLTNGHGEWDSHGAPGRNYHIYTPGEYRLHNGVVTQVKAWQP